MTTFTVWKYDSPEKAEQVADVLKNAAQDHLVKIVDYAVVTWPKGAEKPETHHEHERTRHATGWGLFWGVVVGGLFLVPVVGGAVGATVGAIAKSVEGTGITREQLEKIRLEVTEGTSALFLVTDEGNLDRLGERFHGLHTTLIATNLTKEEQEILLDTFSDHLR
ncbi:DUF1269 domain-containing protein [Paractinoplanes brasiliensis]|uniref:Putative membrane protein n=1 Tax=Paractinoplanes brasiliensis TaxID=52695 RepID=A0A4R6J7E8_9ACTN|nr:DUF1269 domain-containing protein [Actinoplanes brasiliensis]TDO31463.1 putative membrane protein [Actinoplanes brasiliensis]GID30858.1 membrane protein [Actinoplanes brasiliensis]